MSKTSTFGVSERSNHDSTKFYATKLYDDHAKAIVDIQENVFPMELENKIIHGSSENIPLPDGCVHLMVTSPPYNVSKDYDINLPLKEYKSLLKNVFTETYRVLINGGRACINIANVGRKPYIPLSDHLSNIMEEIGYSQRGEVIWDKAASAGGSCAWGSWKSDSNPTLRDVHEYILIFSKGDAKRIKTGKKDTITSEEFLEYTKSIWKMNTVSAKKIGHPAPFPIELPQRLIKLYSFEDDVVLDPFMGSGTTALAALQLNRKYIGYDTDKSYVELAEKRIVEYSTAQSQLQTNKQIDDRTK